MPSGRFSEWEKLCVKKEKRECLKRKYPAGLYGKNKGILHLIIGGILGILS
jgi:hypothetical protein